MAPEASGADYREGDVVLLRGMIAGEPDFRPVKIVRVLGGAVRARYQYVVVNERRMLSAVKSEWVRPAGAAAARCLAGVTARERDLSSFLGWLEPGR